jgi:hypothetical protein
MEKLFQGNGSGMFNQVVIFFFFFFFFFFFLPY